MPFTLVAFRKTEANTEGGLLTPIADQHVTVGDNDLTVPALNFLVAALAFGVGISEMQLRSPSLRALILEDIGKNLVAESCAGAVDVLEDRRDNPLELVVSEKLNVYTVHTTNGWALIWLADGPITPVTGDIRTLKCTPKLHGEEDEWTNSALTLTQTLPAGAYQVVGMRAFGTALLAARLVFVGGKWRPGVPAGGDINAVEVPQFRNGRFGVFGEFEFDQPPSVDLLGTGVTSLEEIYLDLIQTRAGR